MAPIVFYLSPEVPDQWRAYIKRGIEEWQPIFEKAGFRNAIIARDAPTPKEDPEWDPVEGSDFQAVHDGHVSVTPLRLDLTDRAGIEALAGWSLAKD